MPGRQNGVQRPGRRLKISSATLNPTPATWPATRIAPLTGSVPPERAWGRGGGAVREREAVLRCGLAELFAWVRALPVAFGLAAAPDDAFEPRLSLRRPGRERGRLPTTPGSSGMVGKNTPVSGLRRFRARKRSTLVHLVD